MNIFHAIKAKINNLFEIDSIHSDIEKIIQKQDETDKRLAIIEDRLVETSRAMAMLALGHGSLVREFGRLVEIEERRQSKKVVPRKTSDDFTN